MSKLELKNPEAENAFQTALKAISAWNDSFDWPAVQTFVFREVGGLQIEADVYVPETPLNHLEQFARGRPVALFLHGGGWMGGIRTDFPKSILYEFLTRGFVFVSIDYRLLPEVDFVTAQLDDVVFAETWIREKLQYDLEARGLKVLVDSDNVVVIGGSAGAHLASLTPKFWKKPPKALLLLAGPTNLLTARKPNRPLGGGKLDELVAHIPLDPSAEYIKLAMFSAPRTNTIPATGLEGFMQPRSMLGLSIFRKEVIPELLARGFVGGKLPQKGSVPEEEIRNISAFFTSPITAYPQPSKSSATTTKPGTPRN